MTESGQQCNACFRGRWVVRGVRDTAEFHVRFLRCSFCGRCSKQVLLLTEVKRRNRSILKSRAYMNARDVP